MSSFLPKKSRTNKAPVAISDDIDRWANSALKNTLPEPPTSIEELFGTNPDLSIKHPAQRDTAWDEQWLENPPEFDAEKALRRIEILDMEPTIRVFRRLPNCKPSKTFDPNKRGRFVRRSSPTLVSQKPVAPKPVLPKTKPPEPKPQKKKQASPLACVSWKAPAKYERPEDFVPPVKPVSTGRKRKSITPEHHRIQEKRFRLCDTYYAGHDYQTMRSWEWQGDRQVELLKSEQITCDPLHDTEHDTWSLQFKKNDLRFVVSNKTSHTPSTVQPFLKNVVLPLYRCSYQKELQQYQVEGFEYEPGMDSYRFADLEHNGDARLQFWFGNSSSAKIAREWITSTHCLDLHKVDEAIRNGFLVPPHLHEMTEPQGSVAPGTYVVWDPKYWEWARVFFERFPDQSQLGIVATYEQWLDAAFQIAQSHFEQGNHHSLLVNRFDSTWHNTRYVAETSKSSVILKASGLLYGFEKWVRHGFVAPERVPFINAYPVDPSSIIRMLYHAQDRKVTRSNEFTKKLRQSTSESKWLYEHIKSRYLTNPAFLTQVVRKATHIMQGRDYRKQWKYVHYSGEQLNGYLHDMVAQERTSSAYRSACAAILAKDFEGMNGAHRQTDIGTREYHNFVQQWKPSFEQGGARFQWAVATFARQLGHFVTQSYRNERKHQNRFGDSTLSTQRHTYVHHTSVPIIRKHIGHSTTGQILLGAANHYNESGCKKSWNRLVNAKHQMLLAFGGSNRLTDRFVAKHLTGAIRKATVYRC